MKRKIEVIIDVPKEVEVDELAKYVKDAVDNWGGQLRPPGSLNEEDPGDPLFYSTVVKKVRISGYVYIWG